MAEVKVPGGSLQSLVRSVDDLADNRVPLGLAVRINRVREAVEEFSAPWTEAAAPFIEKYTGGASIWDGHEAYPAFRADPEVAALYEEEATIELEPLKLEELAAVRGLSLSADSLQLLRGFGLVTDATPAPEG